MGSGFQLCCQTIRRKSGPSGKSRSYLFAIAMDTITGRTIGIRRVISDGISNAYIQDLVILPLWRKENI
ncbi:MAG: hypothetical protein WB392_14000 [Methanotrichaceae archaeon]